jgi:hypothetical protein
VLHEHWADHVIYADAPPGQLLWTHGVCEAAQYQSCGCDSQESRGVGNPGHEALRLPLLALRHGLFQVAGLGNAHSDRHFLLPHCGSLYPSVDQHHQPNERASTKGVLSPDFWKAYPYSKRPCAFTMLISALTAAVHRSGYSADSEAKRSSPPKRKCTRHRSGCDMGSLPMRRWFRQSVRRSCFCL